MENDFIKAVWEALKAKCSIKGNATLLAVSEDDVRVAVITAMRDTAAREVSELCVEIVEKDNGDDE